MGGGGGGRRAVIAAREVIDPSDLLDSLGGGGAHHVKSARQCTAGVMEGCIIYTSVFSSRFVTCGMCV
jgi:hypothetical protein